MKKPPLDRTTCGDLVLQEIWRIKDELSAARGRDVHPQYTWRTTSGIARQSGLSEEKVAAILKKYNLTLTRLSETPAVSGSALVGLIEKVGV